MADAVPTGAVMEEVVEPLVDENGDRVYDENGDALVTNVMEEVLDKDGNPKVDENGNMVLRKVVRPKLSPGDLARLNAAFLKWATQVLPKIVIPNGEARYETMPGEDMYGIFVAMFNQVTQKGDLFRFVKPPMVR
jgi:hypothetical protein